MSFPEALTLFGILLMLAAMPGASAVLVVTRSATLGLANGFAVIAGIVLADAVLILLAIAGLSLVANTLGGLFVLVKYLGAAYLLWLGYRLLTAARADQVALDEPPRKRSLAASLLAGLLLTLGDIKAIVFYMSLLPAFVDLASIRGEDISIVLLIMICSVGGIKMLYAIAARKIAHWARRNQFEPTARKTAGALIIGAGGYIIAKA